MAAQTEPLKFDLAVIETVIRKARKDDQGKSRVDLVEPLFVLDIGKVMGFGAVKYGDNNWKEGEGLKPDRVYAALQRHLLAYQGGELLDPESGMSHLAHAGCNLMMLHHFSKG